MINTGDIELLQKAKGKNFISIYVPTHRGGEPELEKQDRIEFKNQLNKVKSDLLYNGMNEREVEELLPEAKAVMNDWYFWKHQSDTLALFISESFFRKYTLPIKSESFSHIGSRFYLKPMIPLLEKEDVRFFILGMSKNQVSFYEAERYAITPVKVNDLVPDNVEAALDPDENVTSELQYRTGMTQGEVGKFHGHGGKKDLKEVDVKKYLKQVNDGLMEMLHDEDAPIIIMGDDALVGEYRKVNTYPLLVKEHISGNPDKIDPVYLHELAWDKMRDHFNQTKRKRLEKAKAAGNDRVSEDLEKIIPAAMNGQVDTLFILQGKEVWGKYNLAKGIIEKKKEHQQFSEGLLNFAAIHTKNNGGKVYLLPQVEMPGKNKPVEALLRY